MDDTPPPSNPQDTRKVTAPEPTDALAVAGAALVDALGQVLRRAVRRGRQEVGRAAAQGRVRMELRQLRQDRQRMFEKLGREVVLLVDAGELTHPGMIRGAERIRQVDAQIAQVEADLRARGEPLPAEGEHLPAEGEGEQKEVASDRDSE